MHEGVSFEIIVENGLIGQNKMDGHIHNSKDAKDKKIEQEGSKDKNPAKLFLSENARLSGPKDFSHRLLELYRKKVSLERGKETFSKQADNLLSTAMGSSFQHLQGVLNTRLHGFSSLTREGVYIPGCYTDRSSQTFKKDDERRQVTSPLSEELKENIQQTYRTIHEHASDFYYKAMPEKEQDMFSAGMQAHQTAYVLTYYQLCERAFQEHIGSFDPEVAQKMQGEFRERRSMLEQHMGVPDIQGFLKQGQLMHEGFLSEDMHTRLTHEYDHIESQMCNNDGFHKDRLKELGALGEKLFSAQRVYELTGLRAEYVCVLETPSAAQLSHQLAKRVESIADRSGWEEAMKKVTAVLADEQIDKGVRVCTTKALGYLRGSSNETRRSIATELVGLLDRREIDLDVRKSMAGAIGELGDLSVASQFVNKLDKWEIDLDVRVSMAGAVGTIGKTLAETKKPLAEDLVKILDSYGIERDMRRSIAGALGELGERSVLPKLVAILEKADMDLDSCKSIVKAIGTIGDPSVAPKLVDRLRNERDQDMGREIAETAGALCAKGLVDRLEKGEIDPYRYGSTEKAVEVFKEMPRMVKKPLAGKLVDRLDRHEIDPNVRISIAEALGDLGERSVLPDLVNKLDRHEIDPDVRRSIARAIEDLGEPSVAPGLVDLLEKENIDRRVRASIAEAVGELGDPSVAPRLVDRLDRELDRGVRSSIAEAAGSLFAKGLVDRLEKGEIDRDMPGSIAEATGAFRETPIVIKKSIAKRLVDRLEKENIDRRVRASITEVVGELGDPSVAPRLVDRLDRELDRGVRSSIAEAAGSLFAKGLVDRLEKGEIDRDMPGSIAEATGAFREMPRVVKKSLAEKLVDRLDRHEIDPDVRKSIVRALGDLGERSVLPDLMNRLENGDIDTLENGTIDPRVRVSIEIANAVGSLGKTLTETKLPLAERLVGLFDRENIDPRVHVSIAGVVEDLGEPSVVPNLVNRLAEESIDSDVRVSIAIAVGSLGKTLTETKKPLAEKLVGLLENSEVDGTVRGSIARAVGTLGEASVMERLVSLENRELDPDVRRSLVGAIRALRRF